MWTIKVTLLSPAILIAVSFFLADVAANGQELTPCEIYTENYQCDLTVSATITDKFNCTTDLVGATLDLIDRGEIEIELTEGEEAIMLIGQTGTGKTTLTYFLAGNNSRMISYKKSTRNYLIKDCNGKISGNSTVISTTIFPDLVIDEETQTGFYDNPGFQDTRETCIEIANAFFMMKIANHVKRLKFGFVINQISLVPGQDRLAFISMLKSVIKFIPNIEKFVEGIAIVGTKLQAFDDEDETEYIQDAKNYMLENRESFNEVFDDPNDLRRAQIIVDALTNQTNPSKIAMFRAPTDCGLLSQLENMKLNRKNVMKVFLQNLNYVDSTPSDFDFSLTGEAKTAIRQIGNQLSAELLNSIQDFGEAVYNYLMPQFVCTNHSHCHDLIFDLQQLFNNPDFSTSYQNEDEWRQLNFTDIIQRIINPEFLPPNFELPQDIWKLLNKNSRYLEFLQPLEDLNIDVVLWLLPLRTMNDNLMNQIVGLISNMDQIIGRILIEFSYTFETQLKTQLDHLVQQNLADSSALGFTLKNLFSTCYNLTLNETNLNPSDYMDEIIENVISFSNESISNELKIIHDFSIQLNFLKSITAGKDVSIHPQNWVAPLLDLKLNIQNYVLEKGVASLGIVDDFVIEFRDSLRDYLVPQFECVQEGKDCADLLNDLGSLASNPDFLDSYENEIWSKLTFVGFIERLLNPQFLPANFIIPIEGVLEQAGVLDFFSTLVGIKIDPYVWLQLMKDMKTKVNSLVPGFLSDMRGAILSSLTKLSVEVVTGIILAFGDQNVYDKVSLLATNISFVAEQKDFILTQLGGSNGMQLADFLTKNVDCFKGLQVEISSESIENVIDKISFLILMDSIGHASVITSNPEFEYWLKPFHSIETGLENEEIWNNFILDLYKPLTMGLYQSDENWIGKYWWSKNGDIDDQVELEKFWTDFKHFPTIEGADKNRIFEIVQTDETSRFRLLNQVLTTTLTKFQCQRLNQTGWVSISGNFLSVKDIFGEFSCIHDSPTSVVIIWSFQKIFFDKTIVGRSINPLKNLAILVISPVWETVTNVVVDLNGTSGESFKPIPGEGGLSGHPGNPGGVAGNFIGAGLRLPSREPTVSVDGGKGGDGQSGQKGAPGANGQRKDYNSISCEAAVGGGVKIYVDPHEWWCEDERDDGWCHADDDGVPYEIYGLPGAEGGRGGDGGKGGLGGFGGFENIVMFNHLDSYSVQRGNGASGCGGVDGLGGPGGQGGQRGDTLALNIDDMWNKKYCWGSLMQYLPRYEYGPIGPDGTSGGNSLAPSQPDPQEFDVSTFKPYLIQFKLEAARMTSNQFLEKELYYFLTNFFESAVIS